MVWKHGGMPIDWQNSRQRRIRTITQSQRILNAVEAANLFGHINDACVCVIVWRTRYQLSQ